MMSSSRPSAGVRGVRWTWLVMALVAGVLGMHALAPSGMPASGQHDAMMSVGSRGHYATLAHEVDGDCRHLSDADDGGMVMDHAGGTCAAGGTSTSYLPPALTPAPTAGVERAATARSGPAAGTVDGRAPPDLSELQLLRI
ncbi:DUF6153 family protein [Streptomyces sp. NPDC003720]|uniref:DUF6153 family protein n=1 Tax=Streptomyces sp. NPDC003720 TaxID=3364684 RepID=UPI0036CF991D